MAATGLVHSGEDAAPAERTIDADSVAGTPPPTSRAQLGPCALCGEDKPTKEAWYKCPSTIGDSHYRSGEKVLCSGASPCSNSPRLWL
jgi:hypothetical protein